MAVFKLQGLIALCALTAVVAGQDNLKVWASVVFARAGDRVPPNIFSPYAGQLTPTGARQLEELGSALRENYVLENPLPGLSPVFINPNQLTVLTSDDSQYTVASAQALFQGLYPPVAGNAGGQRDPLGTSLLGHEESPLNNYQYPWIHTADDYNLESIYVNGANACPNFLAYAERYQTAASASATSDETRHLYSVVGQELEDAYFTAESYSYSNAEQVYEYVNFLYNHNKTAEARLNSGKLLKLDALNRLRLLANQYQWNLYGNEKKTMDPISSIAGQALATRVFELLSIYIGSNGQDSIFNVMVGDEAPLISFFALANVQVDSPTGYNPNITGMPNFGSAAMFDLVAPANAKLKTDPYGNQRPLPADLSVRFVFRNGSDNAGVLTTYPLFNTGTPTVSWDDFSTAMQSIALSGPDEWCGACDAWATSTFCMYYNTTYSIIPPSGYSQGLGSGFSPTVAGVIGAFATIAVILLVLVPLILFGGLRFRMERRAAKEPNGGFKGSQKMASDADLAIVKGTTSANVEDRDTKERVGSWELKNQAAADRALHLGNSLHPPTKASRPESFVSSIRPSYDAQDPTNNPFQDPVKPREHV